MKRWKLPNEEREFKTLIESDNGRLVLYEDYARLEAEKERLEGELLAWKRWSLELPIVPFNTNNRDEKVIPRLNELRRWFNAFHEWREQRPEMTTEEFEAICAEDEPKPPTSET